MKTEIKKIRTQFVKGDISSTEAFWKMIEIAQNLLTPLTTDTVSDEEIKKYIEDRGILDHSTSADMQMIAEWVRSRLSLVEPVNIVTDEEIRNLAYLSHNITDEGDADYAEQQFIAGFKKCQELSTQKDKVEAMEFAEWILNKKIKLRLGFDEQDKVWILYDTAQGKRLTSDELYSIFKQSKTK